MTDAATVDEARIAADAKAQAVAQARIDAKNAEPTIEEVEFVAKAMDYDGDLDWENYPERCDNARVEAKRAILGYRACLRLPAAVTVVAPASGTSAPLTKADPASTTVPAPVQAPVLDPAPLTNA